MISSSRRSPSVIILGLSLAWSPVALAETPASAESVAAEPATAAPATPPLAPPEPSPLPPAASPPAAPPPATPVPAAEPPRATRFVAATGWDYGFNRLLTVTHSNGTKSTMQLNGGSWLAAGASFLPLLDGRLETRATVGFKYDVLAVKGGSLAYFAFPVDLMESLNAKPLRLSAGATLLLGPRLVGAKDLEPFSLRLRTSLGVVAQAEWVLPFQSGTGSFSVGLRYVWLRLEPRTGGVADDASAFGAVAGVTL
jgi:hypothetical protein